MFRHSFDDELSVMAEKEEAATPSCTFTCLEDLILICVWAQTVLKYFLVTEEILECFHEEFSSVESDLNIISVSHRLINARHARRC